jgi:hypothetical protein
MANATSKSSTSPSILSQVEDVIDEQAVDGVTAGILVKDGKASAEVKAQKDIGKPGGWTIGAVARFTSGSKPEGAAQLRWKPKA